MTQNRIALTGLVLMIASAFTQRKDDPTRDPSRDLDAALGRDFVILKVNFDNVNRNEVFLKWAPER